MHHDACYGLRWTLAGLKPAAERRAFLPRALAAAGAAFRPLHRADRGQGQVEKLTNFSACFENDWRFCRSAFCTPTSSLQLRGHVVGKRIHHNRTAEPPATEASQGLP